MSPFERQTADAIRSLMIICAILAVATLAGIGLGAVGVTRTQNITSSNCRHIEQLQTAIHEVVIASAAQLGKPGSAGYEYYRTHPRELVAAKVSALTEARQFTPHHC